MEYKIVDTTMRDGEQQVGLAYSLNEKLDIAKKLDVLGVYQIEAGIPAMGGDEKRSILEMTKLGFKSKISAWNRMSVEDIRHSLECNVDIIHISVPISHIQIRNKLKKNRRWVLQQLIKCLEFVSSSGKEITVGLEDASRARFSSIEQVCKICEEYGVTRIRFADTVGIMTPRMTYNIIKHIRSKFTLGIEIHAHNDFGMAVPNSIAAIKAGAEYVSCTLNGIGERAGNCDYYKFIQNVNQFTEI